MIRLVVSEIALCALCAGLALLLARRVGGASEVLTCAVLGVVLYFSVPMDPMPDVQVPVRVVLIGNGVTLALVLMALFDLAVPGRIGASLVAEVLAILSARYLKMARYVEA